MIYLQFFDVYLYDKKNDLKPVKCQEIEVILDPEMLQISPNFEMEINCPVECEKMMSFDGERISLKTIVLDDDEIPSGYLCYDITNWDFAGKRLIVPNPDENIFKYSLPFK